MTGTTWHVWTDGSCKYGQEGAQAPPGGLGCGGWAAIVEHGSDGEVHRGREPSTTNVRMELVAATRGLRATPIRADVVLHTDCTTILCVRDARERGLPPRGPDYAFWEELEVEIAARYVRIDLLGKGTRDATHRRAHGFAGAEARAMLANMPSNVIPLDREPKREQKARRRALAAARDPLEARRRAYKAQARRVWREGLR